jgi:hypothetical protein
MQALPPESEPALPPRLVQVFQSGAEFFFASPPPPEKIAARSAPSKAAA